MSFYTPSKPLTGGGDDNGDEQWRSVTPHYFKVFQIPLLRGRVFDDRDTASSARVIIINNALARKFFPHQDPIGKSIQICKGAGPEIEDSPRQIIGVVADVRESGLTQGKVPVNYIPQSQQQEGLTRLITASASLAWAVRSNLDEKTLSTVLTRAIQSVDPQMPIAGIEPMDNILHDSLSRQNFNMLLLSIFAGSALLLAAIGIYGLMSYSVQQQTQEIGVRIALGADRPAMFRLVLKQGMPPALIGVAAGLAAAFGFTRLLESLLYGVKPTDPLSFFAVAATLLFVATLAVLVPARRAMSVDPVTALRTD
jgi:predicted permease